MKEKSTEKKPESPNQAVVIGTSAGGLRALKELIIQIPKDFPLPVLVVRHISPDATGNILLDALNKLDTINCMHAINGEGLKPGNLYFAPSDHHLLIGKGHKMLVTKGAHENRSRPAIDPLFRSAAVEFGSGAIGVLLTGYLDDGTSGMKAIKKCGGVCIVQDPNEAEYPDMPRNALNNVRVDYCLPIADMGTLLTKLVSRKLPKRKKIPEEILIEAKIADRVLSDLNSVDKLGDQVPFNCPGCGGVLWKVGKDSNLRFRCHTGHAYTAAFLLAEQTNKIEETMWTALRMFEEHKNLLTEMARRKKGVGSQSALERVKMSQVHIDRIRAILKTNENESGNDMPT
ncbi:chemotaxis protein CheB [Mongoliibacter ruber]|uniref:protein-glutamate methylesterase n=1 Tax=Mongoliibacter ruber TaxID=1750599 RepID=A0A2T0WFD8_9BACT|nr:chemotaxis protein CheB [Mongoliibacter ruber]PRY85428.1 two-component system chemotaxis response regulator CheB [Mongoliibacter ruber]